MTSLSVHDQLAAHQRVLAALAAFAASDGPEVALRLRMSDALKPNDGDVGREAHRLLDRMIGEVWRGSPD